MDMLAIDIGKRSFHIHGISNDDEVISKKLSRNKLSEYVFKQKPEVVSMEACASAHYWGRKFEEAGMKVKLIHPRFVKPFVKGAKNDAVDAEAIFEASTRPTMRIVPVKTTAQQDFQMMHRIRDRLISQRTSLINHIRGLLAEYGVIMPKGASSFRNKIKQVVSGASLSNLAIELFDELVDEFKHLDKRIVFFDRRLVKICKTNSKCKKTNDYSRGWSCHCYGFDSCY